MSRIENTSARNTTSTRSLEQRFAREQRAINRGTRAGTLTAEESGRLQSRLDNLHQRFSTDAYEGSGQRSEGFKGALDKFKDARKAAAGNANVDLQKRSENIDRRIENGLKSGALTEAEAASLKEEAAALKKDLASGGDPKALAEKFQALSQKVRAEKHDGDMDVEKRKANFEQRIEKGVADGSLTEQEAAGLREKLSQVGENPDAINSLHRDIFRARHNGEVDTAKMGEALQSKVSGVEGGEQFQRQLDALTQQGAMDASVRMNTLRERLNAFV